jgi:hypothetical protein
MAARQRDEERENRIDMEIIVDAYNGEEQRMGWYYYLDDHLNFPFKADWNGEEVEVIAMSPEEICLDEMFVEVRYREDEVEDIFSVSLVNLDPIDADAKTVEVLEDWNYWVDMGYEFNEEDDMEE